MKTIKLNLLILLPFLVVPSMGWCDDMPLKNSVQEIERKIEEATQKSALIKQQMQNSHRPELVEDLSDVEKEIRELGFKLTTEKRKLKREEDRLLAEEAYQNAIYQAELKTKQTLGVTTPTPPPPVVERAPAHVEIKQEKTIRDLVTEIEKLGPEFKTELKNDKWLVITLTQSGIFAYPKNSKELELEAQEKIRQLFDRISKYSVSKLDIYGHASPQFGGKFQSPSVKTTRAYQYNLDLSNERAGLIGELVSAPALKRVMTAKGMSYAYPVKLRSPTSETECGSFDCEASRRIEVSVKF